MTDSKDQPDVSELRRRAEAGIEAEQLEPGSISPEECVRLIQELRVHQIELEMQNEELRQAHERLAESRDTYADLYDFAPVGYLTLDERGLILEANLTAATLLGRERSRLLGYVFTHFLAEKDRSAFYRIMANILQQQQQQQEIHLKNDKGQRCDFLLDIHCDRTGAGRKRVRIAMTNITELKDVQEDLRRHREKLEELVTERTGELLQVNERLQEANDKLEALFQAAPLAIGVFDDQGRVVIVNPAGERIFGWSLAEMQGRLIPSIPEEEAEEHLAYLRQVLEGESLLGVELKQRRKDGSLFDASVSTAPLRGPEGTIQGFVALAEDITDRKKKEAALQTQARVLASMAEGVTVTDSRGTILYTNPAFDAMFGYEPGELTGRPSNILNYCPPEENSRVVKDILQSIHVTGTWVGEFRNRKKDGQPFFTAARISTIEIGGKRLFISVQEDVTERRRVEEEIRRLASFPELNPNPVLEIDEQGTIVYANPAAFNIGAKYGHAEWIKAFLPPDLKEFFASAREGGPRQYSFDRRINEAAYAVMLHLPHDLPTARLYAVDITERKRTEEALRESEERYRSLFQNNFAVMLIIDPETTEIVDANPAASSYYGYTREELTSRKISTINTLPARQLKKKMQRAYSGEQQQFFFQHRLADGSLRDVEVFTSPIMIKGKKLLYSIVHDNTQRLQAEKELYRSYQRLDLLAGTASELLTSATPQQVIDNLCLKMLDFLQSEVYLNYLADVEDKFLILNANGGITDEEADRIRWLKFGEGICGYTAQERRRVVVENIQESSDPQVEMLKTFGLKTYACHPLLVEGRVLGTLGFGCRHRDHYNPDELGLMNAVADQVAIALDRQQAHQALAESERRYRRLVEMSPDAIIVHQNGRYGYINPSGIKLLGAEDPQDLIGRPILESVHRDFHEIVKGREEVVNKRESTNLIELKILRLDGKAVDVEAIWVPVAYRGQPAIQVMLRDITQRKEAEAALKQERDFSAALLDTLGALVVVLDRDARIVRFNHACEITTGYSFAEVKGKSFADFFLLPEEKASVMEVFQKLQQGNVPSSFENYWLSRNGEKHLLSWSNTALRDSNGKISYLIGTGIDISRQRQAEEGLRQAYDELEERVAERTEQLRYAVDKLLKEITERERAETNLQKSEARFTAFMRNLPGSAIMRDRAGRFLFANEAWEQTLGRRPGETLGKTVDDLWPPEIAAKLNELDRQVLSEKKPLKAMVELPVSGEKRTYLSYRFPIRNLDGEVEMVGSIGIDITDRLKAEEARDRLIQILEATPDFIGSADPEGRLVYLNQAAREMLGLEKEEDYSGWNYKDTMPAWALGHVLREGNPVYLREGSWQGKSAIRRRNGEEIPVSQVILTHRDPEGRIKFFSTICRDISDMKRAEEALRKSEEKLRLLTMQLLTAQEDERKRLAAELHDELGHALLILKLHLSEVEQKLLPDQAELKEKMGQIVEYLTDTVAEVRRLYYALSPGDLEDLGLTTALRNLVEDFQELYPNINWKTELSNIDGLFLLPVQTMIYRIVQEALTNIGKHAYPDHVKIKINKDDQRAIFQIEDDGRGFSMDDVLEGDKRGMGLAAMAQRASLAGGIFDFWSQKNQGARIVFSIPFNPAGEKE